MRASRIVLTIYALVAFSLSAMSSHAANDEPAIAAQAATAKPSKGLQKGKTGMGRPVAI